MKYLVPLFVTVAAFGCNDSASSNEAGRWSEGPSSSGGNPSPRAGTLTAGEIRDLDDLPAWAGLAEAASELARWRLSADAVYPIRVEDEEGQPAVDVQVDLLDDEGRVIATRRTDAQGHAALVGPPEGPTHARAEGAPTARVALGEAVTLTLDAREPPPVLDVRFAIDATGSMCDELAWIQLELADVVARTREEIPGLRVRTGVGVYRDHGDSYVVRSFPFREAADDAAADLRAQSCGGGGDRPEAADEALLDAVEGHAWSERAVGRLLFLVLDAPPHQSPQQTERIQRAIESAQARGIRVVPVAASGIDRASEYLLRGLAVLTGGTYVFLTDDSGVGNDHLEPDADGWEVEPFNLLLIRLLREAAGLEISAP